MLHVNTQTWDHRTSGAHTRMGVMVLDGHVRDAQIAREFDGEARRVAIGIEPAHHDGWDLLLPHHDFRGRDFVRGTILCRFEIADRRRHIELVATCDAEGIEMPAAGGQHGRPLEWQLDRSLYNRRYRHRRLPRSGCLWHRMADKIMAVTMP